MTRFGLDSTSEVPVWAHHGAGSSVALRYLSRFTAKVVTGSEHQRYRAAGIDLVLVFEDSGRPDLAGYDGGKADGEFALAQATAILGTPALPYCIRFAADYDPAGNPQAADAYYDGVGAVIPRERCGPYGSDQMLARQAARGFGTLWQTYAWSGGRFFSSPANTVYQYSNDHTIGGVGVDYNHIYGVDFGQVDRRAPAPADPHNYLRFMTSDPKLGGQVGGPFPTPAGSLDERATVLAYDRIRAHPLIYPLALRRFEHRLAALATRIYELEMRQGAPTTPAGFGAGAAGRLPDWNYAHRGWRFQQLIHRAHGLKIV